MNLIVDHAVNDKSTGHALGDLVDALARALERAGTRGDSFERQETALLELANEAVRKNLERLLQRESDALPERVMVDSVVYRRHQTGNGIYHSLVGRLQVSRSTYRHSKVRNGPTVVPLDLGMGLVEAATPALAYRIALGYAKGPLRWCEEELVASHRRPPSRSTMERIAKNIGTEIHRAVVPLEDLVRETELVPHGTRALTIGLDRTTIPMEEDRESGAGPRSPCNTRRRPYVRQPRPAVTVKYRMGYVGTVAFVGSDGETILTRKYAVPAPEGGTGVIERMFADVLHALKQQPELELGIVQDGAPELWGLMWDALDRHGMRGRFYQLIDRYHVSERLAAVAAIIEPNETKRRAMMDSWERELDQHNNAMERIWEYLNRRRAEMKRKTKKRAELDGHIGYLSPIPRFEYAPVVKRGLPVGSGVTEGACKSLIATRTKRSGQRWRPRGVTAVLTLRSLHQSGRLRIAWDNFKTFYGEEIAAAA